MDLLALVDVGPGGVIPVRLFINGDSTFFFVKTDGRKAQDGRRRRKMRGAAGIARAGRLGSARYGSARGGVSYCLNSI